MYHGIHCRGAVYKPVWGAVYKPVWGAVYKPVWDAVYKPVWDAVYKPVLASGFSRCTSFCISSNIVSTSPKDR
jgi:hypothetical protein